MQLCIYLKNKLHGVVVLWRVFLIQVENGVAFCLIKRIVVTIYCALLCCFNMDRFIMDEDIKYVIKFHYV